MSIRSVKYKVSPRRAAPVTIPFGSDLTFDTHDVAVSAIQEVLHTRVSALPLFRFFEELLVQPQSSPDVLRWLEDGAGSGTEMKRGFSAIFGRFFSRWYLEEHHQLRNFHPIDRSPTIVSKDLVVERRGKSYLPDWVCEGPSGEILLAESKGSHANLKNVGAASAPPLRKAKHQIQRARVLLRSHTTGRLELMKVKGWAVMSRWATELNGYDPLLYVLDPETDGQRMTDTDQIRARMALRRAYLARYMSVLGHPDLSDRLSAATPEVVREVRGELEPDSKEMAATAPATAPRRRMIRTEATRIEIEPLKARRFIGAVIDVSGRPIEADVSTVLSGRDSGARGLYSSLYYVGFDETVLEAALLENEPEPIAPMRVARDTADVAVPIVTSRRDGFVFAPIDAVSIQSETPSELIAVSETSGKASP